MQYSLTDLFLPKDRCFAEIINFIIRNYTILENPTGAYPPKMQGNSVIAVEDD